MPFTLQHKMMMTNEKTTNTFMIDHVAVDYMQFFKVVKKGPLAALLGARIGQKLFPGVTVFKYLQDRRDSEVSNIPKREIVASDHFRDPSGDDHETDVTSSTKRSEAFSKHFVGDIVELAIPGFESKKAKHDHIKIKVLATHKMLASVWMQATTANFDWLEAACTYKWAEAECSPAALKRKLSIDGIEITTLKKVKIKSSDAKRCVVYINYKASNGKWTKKHVKVDRESHSSDSDH